MVYIKQLTELGGDVSTRRETVEEKGWRLFVAGGVRRGLSSWLVRGDHGEYRVESGGCNCPSYSRCSHEVAVEYFGGTIEPPVETVEVSADQLAALIRIAAHVERETAEGQLRYALRNLDAARQRSHDETLAA